MAQVHIHWSYQVSQHPEAAGLIGQWNDLLKTQLQYQRDRNTMQGWARCYRKQYMLWTSVQCMLILL
jgi:hypothetical protein